MSIIQHSSVTGSDLHGVVAFTFDTAAARDLQAVTTGDIGKVARVIADNSFHVLTNTSPVTWTAIAGSVLATANVWSAGQRGVVAALPASASVTPDFATANNFSLTANQNFTLANATNAVAGQSGIIAVTQDATGSRVLTLGANYKKAGGAAIVLTTAAGSVDYLTYYVESATRIFVSLIADVK